MTALRAGRVARELFVSSRPVSWVNTAYPFAAAYLLTTREIDLALVVGTLFFLVPYNLAMYGINDVFDYESDLRNPRKGGTHGAVLDRRMHRITLWAAALSCVPFVIALVELEEGVRMLGELRGVDPEQVKIGMPVTATYIDFPDSEVSPAWTLYAWEPQA